MSAVTREALSEAAADLPPVQDLVCELLAARHRLGEHVWTLARNGAVTRALNALDARGLVNWKHGIVEGTYLAWLTDEGRKTYMRPGYTPPILRTSEPW